MRRAHRNPRQRLQKSRTTYHPSIDVILDVLRRMDRRQAMRLIEAVAALVSATAKGGR